MKRIAMKVIRKVLLLIPKKQRIQLFYLKYFGKFPNLKTPETFSEKIQRRKLYDTDPRLVLCADKVLVKKLVEEVLGASWVIPTLFHGPALPSRIERGWPMPYVIKANHGSKWNIFVRNERERDWDIIEKKVNRWLKDRWAVTSGETLYEDIVPQVLVEPFISSTDELPLDYKIFVFKGIPEYIQVDTGREFNHKRVIFDTNWNKQNFTYGFPLETREIKKPSSLEAMLKAASSLGKDFSFVRIDFYDIGGKPYFGEMTFYPESGLAKFNPVIYDKILGGKWA